MGGASELFLRYLPEAGPIRFPEVDVDSSLTTIAFLQVTEFNDHRDVVRIQGYISFPGDRGYQSLG